MANPNQNQQGDQGQEQRNPGRHDDDWKREHNDKEQRSGQRGGGGQMDRDEDEDRDQERRAR